MPEIGTSGSMSGDGKRSVAAWPKSPRPSSTLPKLPSRVAAFGEKADIGHSAVELTKSGHANLIGNASKSCVRAPEVGVPLLGGPRRPQRKPRASTSSRRPRQEVKRPGRK